MLKALSLLWLGVAPSLLLAKMPALPLSPAQAAQVEALLGQMTLAEKIGQLNQLSGANDEALAAVKAGKLGSFLNVTGVDAVNALQKAAVEDSRLKIPLIFSLDVIHGYATTFPLPLAEASSWDLDLAQRTAAAAGLEAREDGLRWTFAPMVDISRDPRWGRIMEGAGEDPLLGAAFAAARVRGFQMDRNLAACAKHFVGYGASEAGRDYNSVDLSRRQLLETHYPPFQRALLAGAATVMSSFNTLNGLPLAADEAGLRGQLKDSWGFDGLVVSDWNSVGELMGHGVAADAADAARQGLLAGVDIDMVGQNYLKNLEAEVKAGRVPESLVTDAARRVLKVKAWLGLFEDPYAHAPATPATLSPAHRALALEAAQKSCVLLKNEGVLPIRPTVKRIVLIGPLGASTEDPLGNWSAKGDAKHVVSLEAGLRARLAPGVKLEVVQGCEVTGDSRAGFAAALKAAAKADLVLMALGEHRNMSGEAYSRTTLGLPGVQQDLAKEVIKLGKPTVLLLSNGRPLALEWEAAHFGAILETWFLGVESGHAIADLLLGNVEPEGRLTASFPRSVGQVPLYYAALPTARPISESKWTSKYLDSPNTPLYPFGYGLSYTRFEYSDLKLPATLQAGEGARAQVTLRNTGSRRGVETAQLYLRDPLASVSRPVKELRAFKKVRLEPGEAVTVDFELSPASFGLYNRKLEFGVEPGVFEVSVGSDSNASLKGSVQVTGKNAFYPLPDQHPMLLLGQTTATQAPLTPAKSEPAQADLRPAAPTLNFQGNEADTGPAVP